MIPFKNQLERGWLVGMGFTVYLAGWFAIAV
jgi:hypothetical protein